MLEDVGNYYKTTTNPDRFKFDETKTEVAKKRIGKEFNNFITILTTNLKFQDPTDPMKTEDFTQQIVSFASVEQSLNTNLLLEQLIEDNKRSKLDEASSYIGTEVGIDTQNDTFRGVMAKFKYNLHEIAKEVKIYVRDKNGVILHEEQLEASMTKAYYNKKTNQLVSQEDLKKSQNPDVDFDVEFVKAFPAGLHEYVWDGIYKDRYGNFQKVEDGEELSISVIGKSAGGKIIYDEEEAARMQSSGSPIDVKPLVDYGVRGVVQEVKMQDNGKNLLVIKDEHGRMRNYPLSQVHSVYSSRRNNSGN